MLKRFFVYGTLGIALEVFWTGICVGLLGDKTFTGHSSIIMFPIYGSGVLLEPCFEQLRERRLMLRGIVYACLIFAVEYFSGIVLTKLNMCPWSYADAVYNVRGIIRIDYMPLWFMLGIFFESIYHKKLI